MTAVLDSPVVLVQPAAEREVTHWVCHCTNGNVAACGLDVRNLDWADDEAMHDHCPLCAIAWPAGSTCPSGCACEGCWI